MTDAVEPEKMEDEPQSVAQEEKDQTEDETNLYNMDESKEEDLNVSDEKIVMIPDDSADDEYDVLLKHGPPSDDFLDVFNSVKKGDENKNAMDYLCSFAWSQYMDAQKQVVLEGPTKAWIACSIYLSMVRKRLSPDSPYPFSVLTLQKVSGVSIIELFDKLERFAEITCNSKKIKDHIQKVQGCLAVAAVVYKKLLPIFRTIFLEVENPASDFLLSSNDLLKIIWNMFVLLKKHLKNEDLLNSYNLLLCVIEVVYEWICKLELDELLHPDFSEKYLSSDCSILEFLCRNFGGSVLDAKHFKLHAFNDLLQSVLSFDGRELFGELETVLQDWGKKYEKLLRMRAEIDERMFLPVEGQFQKVFDPNFDGSAVDLLRRGPDDTKFADVELLLRMSTQTCLEKLADKKNINSSKTYLLSSNMLFPSTPMSSTGQNHLKLQLLVPQHFQLTGSHLEMMLSEMRDNPVETIACHAEMFAQKFADRVNEETEEYGKDYDPVIANNISNFQDFVRDLFYVILERIVNAEREKKPGIDNDLCNVYRKEEFLQSIFVCALELLFFCHGSCRAFPWSIQLLDLEPICFQKVVQIVIRALPEMNREMVKHLNKKEEEVLEELGWTDQSPLWLAINNSPGCIPSCDVAWKQPTMLAEKYSPVKRMRLDEPTEEAIRPIASSKTLLQFIGKVYYLASIRLTDLCERAKLSEIGKKMCWTLLDHILRNETHLMVNRHLDQNLLCIVYIVAKYIMTQCTFKGLIALYRQQPQAQSHVYRDINVDSSVLGASPSDDGNSRDSTSNQLKGRCGSTIPTGTNSNSSTPEPQNCEKVNLIDYYNKVFLPRVEGYVKTLEAAQDKLIPMPRTTNFGISPMKRTLGDRFQVFVTPLNTPINMQDRRLKYSINQSPRKELHAINQMVNIGNSNYLVSEVPEQKVFTSFRR